MNQKVRKLSYKLYLSIQVFIAALGTIALIWNLVTAGHDFYVSDKGLECTKETLGSQFMDYYNKNPSRRWDETLKRYLSAGDSDLAILKRRVSRELLKRKCSEYLRVSITDFDGSVFVYTNNYIDSYPPSISERARYVGLVVGLTLALLGFFYGLMRWISWLAKE